VGQNKIISGELRITFHKVLNFTNEFFFIIERDALLILMYHKFDYKLQKSTLITFTRWALKKKIGK